MANSVFAEVDKTVFEPLTIFTKSSTAQLFHGHKYGHKSKRRVKIKLEIVSWLTGFEAYLGKSIQEWPK